MNSKQQQIEALWDGVAKFGASESDMALNYVLEELSRLVDAQYAYWMGSVRMSNSHPNDPANGWRLGGIHYLNDAPEKQAAYKEHAQRLNAGAVDASVIANLRNAGTFRVSIISKLMPESWFQSEFYQTMYAAQGKQDKLFVAVPLSDDVESWFGFTRQNHPRPYFDERELEWIKQATRSMKWFHRRIVLSRGLLLAEKPLTVGERRVLNGLLSHKSEAEIAEAVGLTPSTVHTYTSRICRKFKVRGRTGLTALWLGG